MNLKEIISEMSIGQQLEYFEKNGSEGLEDVCEEMLSVELCHHMYYLKNSVPFEEKIKEVEELSERYNIDIRDVALKTYNRLVKSSINSIETVGNFTDHIYDDVDRIIHIAKRYNLKVNGENLYNALDKRVVVRWNTPFYKKTYDLHMQIADNLVPKKSYDAKFKLAYNAAICIKDVELDEKILRKATKKAFYDAIKNKKFERAYLIGEKFDLENKEFKELKKIYEK